MEALKIAVTCVIAAVLYGIVHDQFTARICIEYFTIFHPPIFHTQSPTLLGIGWGIVATWWVGVFFASLIGAACISRFARRKSLFETVRGLLVFVVFGVLLAPILTSLMDAAVVVTTRSGAGYWRLVSCRSEFVTGNSAGGIRIFPADRPSVGRVGVDIAAEFAR